MAFTLNPENVKGAQDIGSNSDNDYVSVEIPFNSLIIDFFEGSNTDELIQRMFPHIKTKVENPFTLDQIKHLHINFHKLTLTRSTSYIVLPEWIAKKKAVMNKKNQQGKCFKWAVIAALNHEEIAKYPQRMLKRRLI